MRETIRWSSHISLSDFSQWNMALRRSYLEFIIVARSCVSGQTYEFQWCQYLQEGKKYTHFWPLEAVRNRNYTTQNLLCGVFSVHHHSLELHEISQVCPNHFLQIPSVTSVTSLAFPLAVDDGAMPLRGGAPGNTQCPRVPQSPFTTPTGREGMVLFYSAGTTRLGYSINQQRHLAENMKNVAYC